MGSPTVVVSMGSDIQSLAIPAKAYDSAKNYALGLTSLKFLYLHSIFRSPLQMLFGLSSAVCGLPQLGAQCAGFQFLDSEGAFIT